MNRNEALASLRAAMADTSTELFRLNRVEVPLDALTLVVAPEPASDGRPDIGDVIVYVGDGTKDADPTSVWEQRRRERTEYLVIDTAYDDKDGHSSLCAILHGNRDPEGGWPLNDWIVVEPHRVEVVRKARYEVRA